MVESLLFIGAGAGAGEKNTPEPVKNGPAPQHWFLVSSRQLEGHLVVILGSLATFVSWSKKQKIFEIPCQGYQKIFLMMLWFSSDLVHRPSHLSERMSSTGTVLMSKLCCYQGVEAMSCSVSDPYSIESGPGSSQKSQSGSRRTWIRIRIQLFCLTLAENNI